MAEVLRSDLHHLRGELEDLWRRDQAALTNIGVLKLHVAKGEADRD